MALALLHEAGLYNDIFCVPPPPPNEKSTLGTTFALNSDFSPDISSWRPSFDAVHELLQRTSPFSSIVLANEEDRFLAWVLSCFIPFTDAPEPQKPSKGGKAPAPIAATVAREGIKAPNRVSDIVLSAVQNIDNIISVKDSFISGGRLRRKDAETGSVGRDVLGKAVRRWGTTWRAQAVYAYLVELDRSRSPERGMYGVSHLVASADLR